MILEPSFDLREGTVYRYPLDNKSAFNILNAEIDRIDISNNPVKIQHYDDINNITTIVNAERDIDEESSLVSNDSLMAPIFNKSKYRYDGLNHWVELKQFLNNEDGNIEVIRTKFEYDLIGNKIKTIDAEGQITKKKYDALNRVTEITYPDQTSTEMEYQASKNKRIITDPNGNETIEVKDWNGNVIEVTKFNNGVGYVSSAVYDEVGNKLTVTDGEARSRDFYYDSLNRLVKEELPGHQSTGDGSRPIITYEYDSDGNKSTVIDPMGNKTEYDYNALGQVTKVTDPAGNEVKKYYDLAGQLIKEVDPKGNSVEVVYDNRGNKIAQIDGLGNLSYVKYDIIGKKIASMIREG